MYFAKDYTFKSDVYSLSIIFWELVTWCLMGSYVKPFSDQSFATPLQIYIQVAKFGLRPKLAAQFPPPFAELVSKGWDGDPEKRPNLESVLASILTIKKAFEQEIARKTRG